MQLARPAQLLGGADRASVTDLSGLVEEVYRWDAPVDVWSVFKADIGRPLGGEFRGTFGADRAPAARSVSVLAAFSEKLEAAQAASITLGPIPTESEDDDDLEASRCFAAVALSLHLRWICSTFEHVPGISVLVR